jgi:hypothetical protein
VPKKLKEDFDGEGVLFPTYEEIARAAVLWVVLEIDTKVSALRESRVVAYAVAPFL